MYTKLDELKINKRIDLVTALENMYVAKRILATYANCPINNTTIRINKAAKELDRLITKLERICRTEMPTIAFIELSETASEQIGHSVYKHPNVLSELTDALIRLGHASAGITEYRDCIGSWKDDIAIRLYNIRFKLEKMYETLHDIIDSLYIDKVTYRYICFYETVMRECYGMTGDYYRGFK